MAAARAAATIASAPSVHGSPWPTSTMRVPVAASDRRLSSLSAAAARAMMRAARVRVERDDRVARDHGVAIGQVHPQLPSVWPGMKTTRGQPGTGRTPSV
jgi:hypothetical protein